jgi:hypothetical protein
MHVETAHAHFLEDVNLAAELVWIQPVVPTPEWSGAEKGGRVVKGGAGVLSHKHIP